jgi:hypothetical protein
MAVFRVEKTKDFTIMCNHHLRNMHPMLYHALRINLKILKIIK